jgi:hypothetical protein
LKLYALRARTHDEYCAMARVGRWLAGRLAAESGRGPGGVAIEAAS